MNNPTHLKRQLATLILIFSAALLARPCSAAPGQWEFTGSLGTERGSHTATLLPNGKVLVAGGANSSGSYISSAELYDPATGTWSSTGSLTAKRFAHTATLLPSGNVLVAGGYYYGELNSAELYDPATGTWSSTGSLGIGRIFTTATLLPSGKVLLASGLGPRGLVSSAEVYDPASGSWSGTGSLAIARHNHTATLLPSGKVLVAGGYSTSPLTSAELYDPTSGTWSSTGSLGTGRYLHTATLLPSGKVLAAAGDGSPEASISAELYDPGTAVTATQVSGRGAIAGQRGTANFNIRANVVGGVTSGSVTFNDAAAGISMTKAKVRTLTFNGNSADLGGREKLGDGSKVTYSVTVTDNGDGSTDTFSISLSNGYSASGTLLSGDIQVQ